MSKAEEGVNGWRLSRLESSESEKKRTSEEHN